MRNMRNFKPMNRQGGWIQIAALALSAVGLISGFVGSQKAEKAAEKQADLEAAQERKVTDEKIRQLGIEERSMYGETIASYAGSGVQVTPPGQAELRRFSRTNPYSKTSTGYDIVDAPYAAGASSPLIVLAEQAKEFAMQRKITKEVGATKVQASLQQGKSTADYYRYSGIANAASSASNLLTTYLATK